MIRAFLSAGAMFVGATGRGSVLGIRTEADPDDKVKIRGFLSWLEDFVFGIQLPLLRVVSGIHRYSGFPWGTSIAPHVS